jgi:hypothetical protein
MLGGYREFAIEKGFLLSISSRWNGAIVDRRKRRVGRFTHSYRE